MKCEFVWRKKEKSIRLTTQEDDDQIELLKSNSLSNHAESVFMCLKSPLCHHTQMRWMCLCIIALMMRATWGWGTKPNTWANTVDWERGGYFTRTSAFRWENEVYYYLVGVGLGRLSLLLGSLSCDYGLFRWTACPHLGLSLNLGFILDACLFLFKTQHQNPPGTPWVFHSANNQVQGPMRGTLLPALGHASLGRLWSLYKQTKQYMNMK